MKKHILLFLAGLLAAAQSFGQVNFRATYTDLNPIPHDAPLPVEEKVKIHQAFLDKATQDKDDQKQFYGYVFIFHDYLKAHDFAEATRYLLKAEGIAKASGNTGWQGAMSHQRGILSLRLRDYEGAILHYKNAAELCGQAGDTLCMAESLEQVSGMYGQLGDFKEAQRYFDLAIPLIEKHGAEATLSATMSNFGILLSQQDRPKEAIPYIKRALSIYTKLEKPKEKAQALNNLADAYRRLRQYDLAIETYQLAIRTNQEFNILENLIINYMGLYVLYEERKDFRAANESLIKYYIFRDSIIGAETHKQIAELEAKYENQQQELALQKSQAALLIAEQSLEHGVILIIGMLLLAIFGIWRWRTQSHRAKQELTQHRENLNELTRTLLEKNTLLTNMEAQLSERSVSSTSTESEDFEGNLYNQRILTDADWSSFKLYFEKAYPGYLMRLRKSFNNLTGAEERLFLFIKLNLTSKEAAFILGISVGSVKKTRHRLRKRLELDEEVDLEAYIHHF